jgi:hypothetical protein
MASRGLRAEHMPLSNQNAAIHIQHQQHQQQQTNKQTRTAAFVGGSIIPITWLTLGEELSNI